MIARDARKGLLFTPEVPRRSQLIHSVLKYVIADETVGVL